jgi:hypothetical protein
VGQEANYSYQGYEGGWIVHHPFPSFGHFQAGTLLASFALLRQFFVPMSLIEIFIFNKFGALAGKRDFHPGRGDQRTHSLYEVCLSSSLQRP